MDRAPGETHFSPLVVPLSVGSRARHGAGRRVRRQRDGDSPGGRDGVRQPEVSTSPSFLRGTECEYSRYLDPCGYFHVEQSTKEVNTIYSMQYTVRSMYIRRRLCVRVRLYPPFSHLRAV